MTKYLNIWVSLLIAWYIACMLIGGSSVKWSMISHIVESCFFILIIQSLINTPFLITWVGNLACAFNAYRIIVCFSFFLREGWFIFMNSNFTWLLGLSMLMFGFVIFNRVKYDR